MGERQAPRNKDLAARLRALEDENARLRAGLFSPVGGDTVRVPEQLRSVFDAAQETVRACAPVAEKGLDLAVDVDPNVPPWASGDSLRLRQVVLNLAGNAVKFTEEGAITLRARWLDPDALHLEVEDSGIGIPESKTARLFEPFVQADDSDTRRFAGTGLGLSIAGKPLDSERVREVLIRWAGARTLE